MWGRGGGEFPTGGLLRALSGPPEAACGELCDRACWIGEKQKREQLACGELRWKGWLRKEGVLGVEKTTVVLHSFIVKNKSTKRTGGYRCQSMRISKFWEDGKATAWGGLSGRGEGAGSE